MHCLHPEGDGDIKRMLSTPPRMGVAVRRLFLFLEPQIDYIAVASDEAAVYAVTGGSGEGVGGVC